MFWLIFFLSGLLVAALAAFCVFFDQAVLNRSGTTYRLKTNQKKVVLTFDDGPSPIWTPRILDELKKEKVKAIFFMVGYHVKKYPEIAKRVADEGHVIANHGFAHSVVLYYTPAEIEEEIKYTEHVIKEVTGVSTTIFRPPKAWMKKSIKDKIKSMGYDIMLWSINAKDWAGFKYQSMVSHITRNIKPGDIILFHDSGNVFTLEGGDRTETVRAIPLLVKTLRAKGYEFTTSTGEPHAK
jgi:peptidoglycan/xylan/chitin deacetylase (PgdA/CDA1 family)